MITAYSTAKVAVDAMKAGAYDYLTKPFEIDELRLVVNRALEKIELERENRDLRKQIATDGQFGRLLGKSARMQQLFGTADQVAATDVTVLIHGESGTGKELLAREMHDRSPRKKAAFIAVNCAALPDTLIESELFGHEKGAFTGASEQRKGKFELAHGGTLFLDEIGDMNPLTQAKVLRAIEERRIERLGGSASYCLRRPPDQRDAQRPERRGRSRTFQAGSLLSPESGDIGYSSPAPASGRSAAADPVFRFHVCGPPQEA